MSEISQEQFVLVQQYYKEADALYEQKQYDAALLILEKANEMLLPLGQDSDILRANILHSLSRCHYKKNNSTSAFSFNQQALDLRIQVLGETEETTLESHIFRGEIWYHLGKYAEELQYYLGVLDKCRVNPPNNSLQFGILYYRIGISYNMLQDFWQSNLYSQKALGVFQALESPNTYWEKQCIHLLAGNHYLSDDYARALHYFQKLVDQYTTPNTPSNKATSLYFNMGGLYHEMRQYQQAIDCYEKCLEGLKKTTTKQQTVTHAFVYLGLGRTYIRLKNYTEAHQYLQKSLTLHCQLYSPHHPNVTHIYYALADLHLEGRAYVSALEASQLGLQIYAPSLDLKDIYKNPSLEDLQTRAAIYLLAIKGRILHAYYLESEVDKQYLSAALESADLAVQASEQMRLSYHSDYSKLQSEEAFTHTYQLGLQVGHTAWSKTQDSKVLERAFRFAEKAKAILLLSAMQGEVAKIKSPIPSSLLQREEKLRAKLIQLDNTLQQQKASKTDATSKDSKIQAIQIDFLKYHQEYSQLMKQMEEIHPDYYQLKYQTQAISIAEVQTLLQAEELLIQYCVYPNELYVFAIAADSIGFEVVEPDTDLTLLIEDFQKAIFLSDLEEYISIAQQLYALLLKPIEAEWTTKKQLTIIPDGALHRLNFDALIHPISPTESESIENFSQLPYLLRDFQVRYHYSATLIGQSHQKTQLEIRREIEDGFLGVAPVKFGKRATGESGYILKSKGNGRQMILKSGVGEADALVDLAETEVEVKKVYELFEASDKEAIALFYEMASKENLLKYIEDYKHILLSSHGFSDTENAALSGLNLYVEEEGETAGSTNEKGKLYLSEVMNLQLKADLVVLSSCESGVGKLQKGEGMMALHRAFLYAGASNIIYSLFKVPQDSTSELVQTFFGYVLEGDNYSTALRKAKLKLIGDESIEPIDWAGFALIGV